MNSPSETIARRNFLLFQPKSGANEIPVYCHQCRDHSAENGEGDPDRDVGDAEESVTEAVDEVEDRVYVGHVLRNLWERVHAIEDTTEVHERCEHKRRHDVDTIYRFRIDAVYEACEREYQCGEECE